MEKRFSIAHLVVAVGLSAVFTFIVINQTGSQRFGSNYQAFDNFVQIPASGPFTLEKLRDKNGQSAGWKYTLWYGDRDIVWRTITFSNPFHDFSHKIALKGHYHVTGLNKFDFDPKTIFMTRTEDGAVQDTFRVDGIEGLYSDGINPEAMVSDEQIKQMMSRS